MEAFATMHDDVFGDPNMAVDAVYTPAGGGSPVACRVVRRNPDADWRSGTGTNTPARTVKVRRSELTVASEGGQLAINGETFPVLNVTVPDRHRLLWQLELGDPV